MTYLNVNSPLISRSANGTTWREESHFVPIPELSVSDADLLLVFLSPEGTVFLNRTDDPWYRGTVPGAFYQVNLGSKHIVYLPEEAASPMGCVQRFQYCNSSKECGRLASSVDALASAMPLFHLAQGHVWSGLNSSQMPDATAKRFMMFQSTIHHSPDLLLLLTTLGPSSLLSIQHLMQGLMGSLPDNQWQLDVSHWFAMRLASLQANFVNTARGPTDETVLPFSTSITEEIQVEMCNNQVSNGSAM